MDFISAPKMFILETTTGYPGDHTSKEAKTLLWLLYTPLERIIGWCKKTDTHNWLFTNPLMVLLQHSTAVWLERY